MSSRDVDGDIKEFLDGINLGQYAPNFQSSGYNTLQDCAGINNHALQQIGISPTGHRRRILKQLEAVFTRMLEKSASAENQKMESAEELGNGCSSMHPRNPNESEATKLVSSEWTSMDLATGITPSYLGSCHLLNWSPEVTAVSGNALREKISSVDNLLGKVQSETVIAEADAAGNEMKSSQDECQILASLADTSPGSPFVEFKGEMVENDLYGTCNLSPAKVAPRSTRSFILRHRPVPEIPGSATPTPPPISPYGETFLISCSEDVVSCCLLAKCPPSNTDGLFASSRTHNNIQNQKVSEDVANSEPLPQEDKSVVLNRFIGEAESFSVKECARYARRGKYRTSRSTGGFRSGNRDFSTTEQMYDNVDELTNSPEDSITPYACFYGPATKKVKEGWLDKLSPQGKHMFQKRWVKFDGGSISYYNNDKEVYSKGIILLAAMSAVRIHGDNKFEVVTAHRIFVFRTEKEDERNDWVNTIKSALHSQPEICRERTSLPPEKSGYLELKGYKAKIFTLLQGHSVWICKNDQDFKTGYGITLIPMNVANVRQIDRTAKPSFEIITPYRNFSFTAETEKEKQEWIEALQQSIAETLSDYEVAEKIWFNESNRFCADCKAPDPDWASINLCVVICNKCAGQHRSLGPRDSKVRSLKMDASIWSNELIELFIVIGNKRANSFWEGNLPPGEELLMDAATDRRLRFITQKYKEGRFRRTTLLHHTKEELNKALCAAVVKQDVWETMMLLFSGADVMCATGDSLYSTPYLLAKKSGQRLQMEFLYHNKFSDFSNYDAHSDSVSCQDSSPSTFLCDYLYKLSFSAAKLFTERKLKEECNKRWCALESSFLSYYENEKTASPKGMLDINEVTCLAVQKADSFLYTGAIFTFEIYLLSERVFLFGAETAYTQRKWTQAIAKLFVPIMAKCLLERDYDVIGQLYYKDCHNLDNWKKGWFAIEKSSLYFCLELENYQEDSMHLRRLQELTVSSIIQNGEKIDVLLLVEKGRTLYIHGHTKLDFTVWHSAIEKAAGTDGNVLEDQQLSKNDVPIIVNSCIAFVTQYGLGSKNIYLNGGNPSHVSKLLESFKKDARSVKLRAGTHQLEDVTDTLKSFLSEINDALLTKELYPFWISALGNTSLLWSIGSIACVQVHEEQVKQMDIENSFITKWKDTQVSQAGDLLIEVYVERRDPDCSVIIRVSPMMEAEELTNDILGIKNITPHKDDVWATFEVIENGELERPLHYNENVLEQILHWSSLPNPSSACLVIKKFLTADAMKLYKGIYLKYKEEPSKLLSGNKFQDRYFVLQEGNFLLYKDIKSNKPEKVLPVKSLKLYLGVKKKMKPPTSDTCPPDGKTRKQSITKNPKIGGLPLIPIQHERCSPKNSGLESENNLNEDKKSLKERVSRVAQCLERKEEKARSCTRKHRSLICLDDMDEDVVDLHQRPYKESKSSKKTEDKASRTQLESDKKLPANVIQELHMVLERHRALHEESSDL
uniref:ArfGAP with RhoGAP domain, ankyrin repeat and PH domain 2 n=1 Tax=Varanus komodoensis TaxID=61221 RepID=A0A8D2JA96_VARKO